MWHLFHYVSNCPECTVESEKKTAFEEHLTQKHHFLFVYFDEYECGIYWTICELGDKIRTCTRAMCVQKGFQNVRAAVIYVCDVRSQFCTFCSKKGPVLDFFS